MLAGSASILNSLALSLSLNSMALALVFASNTSKPEEGNSDTMIQSCSLAVLQLKKTKSLEVLKLTVWVRVLPSSLVEPLY